MKKLKNCIKLSSRITVYVPATVDVNTQADNSRQVDETARFLSSMFGGATSTPAIGYWLSTSSGLVRENTTIVFAYAAEKDVKANIDKVVEYCEALRDSMRQEAIAIELNGEMYFI